MKGVESVLPTTKQTTTTTITKTSYGDGDDGERDLLKNKGVSSKKEKNYFPVWYYHKLNTKYNNSEIEPI